MSSKSSRDRLLEDALDERQSAGDSLLWQELLAADPDTAASFARAKELRALLRSEETRPLDPRFAARVRARAHFAGPPRLRPLPFWREHGAAAAALVAILLLPVAYWLGQRDARPEHSAPSTAVASAATPLGPLPAPVTRAARLTLSDIALSSKIPPEDRDQLLRLQFDAFGLREFSQQDRGQVAGFFQEVDRSLRQRATAESWRHLQERATAAPLWQELKDREDQSLWVVRVPADEAWRALELRLDQQPAVRHRAQLKDVFRLKHQFVYGNTQALFSETSWSRHLEAQSPSAFHAPVFGVITFGLYEQGFDRDARTFFEAWWPEREGPLAAQLFERLQSIPRPAPTQVQEMQTEPEFIIRLKLKDDDENP